MIRVDRAEVEALYRRFIDAWNAHDAEAMGATFADDGEMIGFDGSQVRGRDAITTELSGIFSDHETAPYVTKVKEVRLLADDVALLRSVAGMVPPGQSDINPDVNAHHSMVARRSPDGWAIELFQNTPAQFHGRPELTEQLTEELRSLL